MSETNLWDEICTKLQHLDQEMRRSQSYQPNEYKSCIRVNGKPILPPLMTTEKRQECQRWKSKAIEVERRLHQRRNFIETDDGSDNDPMFSDVVPVDDQESDPDDNAEPIDAKTISAFKTLIHKLRGDIKSIQTETDDEDKQLDFIEQSLSHDDHDEHRARQRHDSYTLEEPSPLLQAYMDRYGDADMSFGSKHDPKPHLSPETKEQCLNDFIDQVNKMPSITKDKTKSPTKPKIIDQETDSESLKDISESQTQRSQSATEVVGAESKVLSAPQDSAVTEIDSPQDTEPPSSAFDDGTNASVASSAINSVSIHLTQTQPVSDRVEEEKPSTTTDTETPSDPITTVETPFTARTAETEFTEDDKTLAASQKIEAAVSSLAKEQQKRIEELMAEQQRQRDQMKDVFEKQQQELIQQIMASVKDPLPTDQLHLPISSLVSDNRPPSPVVPALALSVRPQSTLPTGYKFPPEAVMPELHSKWCKLSAIGKGYLVRKLMKTIRVQTIIESMRDTMNMALQLHQEARSQRRSVTKQDVDLHRRLLLQLNRSSADLHHIFFDLSTKERMAILKVDAEMRQQQEERSQSSSRDGRRLSAATKAKLEREEKQLKLLQDDQQSDGPRRKRWDLQNKENKIINIRAKSLELHRTPRTPSQARRSLYNITSSVSSSSNASQPPRKGTKKSSSSIVSTKSNVVVHKKPWK